VSLATDSLQADRAELLKICSALTDADWQAPSGCAGWSVKDIVAHLAALYWLVADRSKLPDVTGLPTERAQDVYVEQRRSMTPAQVLADYEAVSAAALPALASLDGQTFELPLDDLGTYPAGVVPTAYSFDHYVHIRLDLFAPRGPLGDNPPPSDELRLVPTLDWIVAALPQQNQPALAGLPGGIEFEITGPGARSFAVGSGAPVGRVAIAAQPFVLAITARGDWSSARVESADAGLAGLLTELKVF
jgi:uncharacterized protein (TIGR03083 family)